MGEWLSTVSYWHLTKCPKQNEFTSLFLNHQAATALTPILTAITRSPISQGPEKFTVTSTFQWAQVSTSFTFSEAGAGVEEGQQVPACLSSMHGTCVYVCVGRGGAADIIRPRTQAHQLPLITLMRHLQTDIAETLGLGKRKQHTCSTNTHTCTVVRLALGLINLWNLMVLVFFYIWVINLVAHIQISPSLYSRTADVTERSTSRGKSRIQKMQLQTIEDRIICCKKSETELSIRKYRSSDLCLLSHFFPLVAVTLQQTRFKHYIALYKLWEVKIPESVSGNLYGCRSVTSIPKCSKVGQGWVLISKMKTQRPKTPTQSSNSNYCTWDKTHNLLVVRQ